MARVETTIEIERPLEEVFDYLTDLENATEWTVGLVDVTYDGELKEGATGTDVRRMGKKEITMPWRVLSFERPNRVVFEYGGPFPATANFSFAPTPIGTRVTCLTDLRPRGLWRLLGPVMAAEGRKSDRAQFQKVKEILEHSGNGSPVGEER